MKNIMLILPKKCILWVTYPINIVYNFEDGFILISRNSSGGKK